MCSALSILQIEDDPLWRDFCAAALQDRPEVGSLETAVDGAGGLALAQLRRPDIVLLDLRLPDIDGFVLLEQLAKLRPRPPKILILSVRNDAWALFRSRDERVHGFLWKTGDIKLHLLTALTALAQGNKYYPADVRQAWTELRADPSAFFKILSSRELDLMHHFASGLGDAEIAQQIGLSTLTVKSHRQHVMTKIGVHSTPQLIHWAIRAGFGRGDGKDAPK
ncbi:MAG: response regulator transcription factor [Opitutae bacterium]|nr:response regulator transcription factor [Opitutae bacterium]